MVNCTPETVSTDYDTSDRLYFEPLTEEDVLEIVATERSQRHIAARSSCSSGARRAQAGRRLGTRHAPSYNFADAIDLAEDRDRSQEGSTSSRSGSQGAASPRAHGGAGDRRGDRYPIMTSGHPDVLAGAPWKSFTMRRNSAAMWRDLPAGTSIGPSELAVCRTAGHC